MAYASGYLYGYADGAPVVVDPNGTITIPNNPVITNGPKPRAGKPKVAQRAIRAKRPKKRDWYQEG